eukprot:2755089-Rhodomonas_salina.4
MGPNEPAVYALEGSSPTPNLQSDKSDRERSTVAEARSLKEECRSIFSGSPTDLIGLTLRCVAVQVAIAGVGISWLKDNLKIIDDVKERCFPRSSFPTRRTTQLSASTSLKCVWLCVCVNGICLSRYACLSPCLSAPRSVRLPLSTPPSPPHLSPPQSIILLLPPSNTYVHTLSNSLNLISTNIVLAASSAQNSRSRSRTQEESTWFQRSRVSLLRTGDLTHEASSLGSRRYVSSALQHVWHKLCRWRVAVLRM